MSEVTASGNVLDSFDETLGRFSGGYPPPSVPIKKMPTAAVSDDESSDQPLLTQPAWLQSDCLCRGGQWVGADPQDPNRGGNCVPSDKPTGKYFDILSRGCKPLPGGKTQGCTYKGVNVCLLGFGLALGGLAIFLMTRKKPA